MKQAASFNTTSTAEKRLSPFIKKLWRIMNDCNLRSIIHWSEHGTTICISNSILFCKSVLPHYFKHNNWHSFVRQLNLYGFRKVYHFSIAIDYASGRQETVWQFKHRYFQRDDEESLLLIQRKISSYPSSIEKEEQRFVPLMSDLEKKLDSVEKKYEELKRETLSLRQQQHNQQKLLQNLMKEVLSVSEKLYPVGPAQLSADFQKGIGSNVEDGRGGNSRKNSNSFDHSISGDNASSDHSCSLPPLADMMSSLTRE